MKKLIVVFGVMNLLFFSSCFVGKDWKENYKTPKYVSEKNWLALPFKKDFADKVPKKSGLKDHQDSAKVDVFFVHNTTFWLTPFPMRAVLFDPLTNALSKRMTIRQQASVFNGSCRVYAPKYRQASLISFSGKENGKGKLPFEFAYEDVKNAFKYYLENYNLNRPFIIAGHSQGSYMVQRLIKDYIDTDPELAKRLICAYTIGWANSNVYTNIPVCDSASQTGCILGWQTVRWGAKRMDKFPGKFLFKPSNIVTNPLTWTRDTVYVSKEKNLGSTRFFYNKMNPGLFDAQIHGDQLWTHKVKKFGYLRNVIHYHLADYNLFYMDIRKNVGLRVGRYLAVNLK